jgi:hypothetical protein
MVEVERKDGSKAKVQLGQILNEGNGVAVYAVCRN